MDNEYVRDLKKDLVVIEINYVIIQGEKNQNFCTYKVSK